MATVYHITPYMRGDIGGGINEHIRNLPDDAWVCLRDSDTLFLTSDQQKQIQSIADSEPPFDVIGCRTNRLRSDYQVIERERLFDCGDISTHIEMAKKLEAEHWGEVTPLPAPEVVAGMLMLFRVSLWRKYPIPRRSIYFDKEWCELLRVLGYKLGIAQGIYLFHLYRWGAENPYSYTAHLK